MFSLLLPPSSERPALDNPTSKDERPSPDPRPDDELRALRITALSNELDRCQSSIQGMFSALDRHINFALLVLGAGVTIGFGESEASKWVLILLPLPLTVIALATLNRTIEMNARGGYARHLEEALNLELQGQLLAWEGAVASKLVHFSPSNVLLQLFSLVVLGIAWVASLWRLSTTNLPGGDIPDGVRPIVWVVLALTFVCIIVGTMESRSTPLKAYVVSRHMSHLDKSGNRRTFRRELKRLVQTAKEE